METGKAVKKRFKSINELEVRDYTDSSSFNKGNSYFSNSYIYDPTLRGASLTAMCAGSSGGPYRVKANLVLTEDKSEAKLVDWDCSCPRGGFCKHIVALLLTWIKQPENFEVRPTFADLLKDKSREELLVLIERMLKQAQELETLVELPIPVSKQAVPPGMSNQLTVNPVTIRRQVVAAFRNSGNEWGSAVAIAEDLDRLRQIGDTYAEAGQWANAQAVYAVIIEEATTHYEETDDEGEIITAIDECAVGLIKCLEVQTSLPQADRLDSQTRQALLKTLYDLREFDYDYSGGEDVDLEEEIAQNVTDEERTLVETWLRRDMKPGGNFSNEYRNQHAVNFLMKLKIYSNISDEDLLNEYRQAGLYKDMAIKLIQLGRLDEALKVAEEHLLDLEQVTRFAEQLLAQGGEAVNRAFALVEQRLKQSESSTSQPKNSYGGMTDGSRYVQWLGEKYGEQGRLEQAITMQLRWFQNSPSHQTYLAVKKTAQLRGQPAELWASLRPGLLSALEKQENWRALLEIYLSEGEVGDALFALGELERTSSKTSYYGYGWADATIQVRVAQAAEVAFPQEAIRLYQQAAEKLIDARGRDKYQEAAGYLSQVRLLYEKLGRQGDWHIYITRLRDNNKSLRALREELDTLGLK